MVQIQIPEALTLEDLAVVAAIGLALLTLVIIIVGVIRQQPARQPKPAKPRPATGQKRLDFFHKLAKEMGLDKILIRELENIIHDGLEKGRVRLSLASDECPGYVVLDVPSRRFLCIDNTGRAWPLEGEAKDEIVEYEDEGEVREHGV